MEELKIIYKQKCMDLFLLQKTQLSQILHKKIV